MTYPKKHRRIVSELLDGKFITIDDSLFHIVKENSEFYTQFFKKSFNYQLVQNQEFYYLLSTETDENTSRDISIFFSILCSEIDKSGRNFLDDLHFRHFDIQEIVDYIRDSSWKEVANSTARLKNPKNVRRFVKNTLQKRNIAVHQGGNIYTFTKAHKLFIDYARDLVREEEE